MPTPMPPTRAGTKAQGKEFQLLISWQASRVPLIKPGGESSAWESVQLGILYPRKVMALHSPSEWGGVSWKHLL